MFGAVNGVLDSVRGFIDSVPGVELPSLPTCAQFPDASDKLLDLTLFSWNNPGTGLALHREGLAWFELLKFYRYLTGHTDFSSYTDEVNQRLREMQQTLGANLARRLSRPLSCLMVRSNGPPCKPKLPVSDRRGFSSAGW